MQNILFLRHGKVALKYASHDDMPFEVLNNLATRKLDPESDPAFMQQHESYLKQLLTSNDIRQIFHSPSNRCVSLAKYLNSLAPVNSFEMLPDLNEIEFDLEVLFGDDKSASLSDVTSRLISALTSGGSGTEPIEKVADRMRNVMRTVANLDHVLLLTHGYFLRFMVASLAADRLGRPLSIDDLLAAPRFNYFEGFILDESHPPRIISPSNLTGSGI